MTYDPRNTTVDERNSELFFEIADMLEFWPERYNQRTYGEFTPDFHDGAGDKFKVQFGYDVEGDAEDYNWIYADEGCGSAMCIAGHAAAFSGWFPTITGTHRDHPEVSWTTVHTVPHQSSSTAGSQSISEVAEDLLGINYPEARFLFDSEHVWTANDLRKFAEGEPILPRQYHQ